VDFYDDIVIDLGHGLVEIIVASRGIFSEAVFGEIGGEEGVT